MKIRFEEQDPLTGLIKRWYVDPDGDKVVIETINPHTQGLIDGNRALYNDSLGKRWGEGKIFASVPLEIAERELGEAVRQKDWRYLKKWMNDSDHRNFRRFHGKV